MRRQQRAPVVCDAMNPAKMRAALSDPDGRFPEAAMQWARGHAAEATPALLALLTACAKGGDLSDREAVGAFYALPLLAEFRESRAFPIVCALARNGDRIDDIFADFGAEFLPRLLVGIYGDDAKPLLDIAADPSVDATVRASFLRAWCFDKLQTGLDATASRQTLDGLRSTFPLEGGFLVFEWLQALIVCDPEAPSSSLRDMTDALPHEAISELEQDIAAWREDYAGQRNTYLIENGPDRRRGRPACAMVRARGNGRCGAGRREKRRRDQRSD